MLLRKARKLNKLPEFRRSPGSVAGRRKNQIIFFLEIFHEKIFFIFFGREQKM